RFNNQMFMGRSLAVNEARERDDRSRSTPRSFASSHGLEEQSGPTERVGRNFGPDAAPRRSRKPEGRGSKSERAPKQPMRERPGGQFFGDDDEDNYEGDLGGENFACRVSNEENECAGKRNYIDDEHGEIMRKKSRPTFDKREKEKTRQLKQKDKQARRMEAKERRAGTGVRDHGEDRDIAGIRPGPQALPEQWQYSDRNE